MSINSHAIESVIDKLPRSPEQRILKTQEIEQRVSARLDSIHAFLNENDGAKLKEKLERSSLKDLAIVEGIAYDKLLLLRGQPNVIFGTQEHRQLDDLVPAVLKELQRRGSKLEMTERKAVITTGVEEVIHAPTQLS